VRTSRDGRWLVVSASVGTAPRDDVWLADLAGDGTLREVQVGVDAQTTAWVARDGRLWLMTDRDAPRWRLAVADPADPASWVPAAWHDVIPQADDAVLSDLALVDGPDGDLRVLAVHSVDATDRLSLWAADGSLPDLTVLLDIDPALARERLDAADKPFDRLEAEKAEFHTRVREAFLALAVAEPQRFLVVDATQDPEDLAVLIRARVAALF
jgi:hypothetical protein